MQLIEWQAVSIARCPDNIYAETIGCQYATLLAAKWYALLSGDGPVRVVIQGDILPLIQYLNYNARLRYPGIQHILLEIKRVALQQLPCHTYAYLPREGNMLADYFAGEGALQPPPPCGEALALAVNPPHPAKLRNKLQIYQAIEERSITLDEKPNIDLSTITSYWHAHPSHRAELCKYIEYIANLAKSLESRPLSAGWLMQIHTIFRNALALCNAAHLKSLKDFDKKIADLCLKPGSYLRPPHNNHPGAPVSRQKDVEYQQ